MWIAVPALICLSHLRSGLPIFSACFVLTRTLAQYYYGCAEGIVVSYNVLLWCFMSRLLWRVVSSVNLHCVVLQLIFFSCGSSPSCMEVGKLTIWRCSTATPTSEFGSHSQVYCVLAPALSLPPPLGRKSLLSTLELTLQKSSAYRYTWVPFKALSSSWIAQGSIIVTLLVA